MEDRWRNVQSHYLKHGPDLLLDEGQGLEKVVGLNVLSRHGVVGDACVQIVRIAPTYWEKIFPLFLAQNERGCHQRQCSYSTHLFSHLREAMNHPKGLCQNLS